MKGIAGSGVVVLVAGSGGLSYRAFENGVLDAGAGTPYDAWTHWRDTPGPLGTVAAAVLAANPHNIQPWLFVVTPGQVDLFADPSRRAGAVDPLDRERHVGLGCAVENLVLAAPALGLNPTVSLLPSGNANSHIARITLTEQVPVRSALYDAIGDRHSNRGPYSSRQLPPATLTALSVQTSTASAGTDAPRVQWVSSPGRKAKLGGLLVEAAQAVVADREQSRDAFAWFRDSRASIDAHRDGLTLDGQGLAPLTLAVAKLLRAGSRSAGDTFWVDQTRNVHTRTAAAYGIVTVTDSSDPSQRIDGGRLLQRLHLAATTMGLALQHMNQITERIDRDESTDVPDRFAERLGALVDDPGRQALSTFRIGYGTRPARLSPRRALGAVAR